MNAPLHPTMAGALRGIVPVSFMLVSQAAAVPPNPQTVINRGSMYPYQFTGAGGLVIDCWLDYTPAFNGGTGPDSEESYPASIELCHALVNGVDIAEVLSDDVVGLIEEEALASIAMDGWDDQYDRAQERAECAA